MQQTVDDITNSIDNINTNLRAIERTQDRHTAAIDRLMGRDEVKSTVEKGIATNGVLSDIIRKLDKLHADVQETAALRRDRAEKKDEGYWSQ